MMISSTIPFPPLSWWQSALQVKKVTFDLAEHYQKMSYQNRYYLASAQGKLLLSVPLEKGRNQRNDIAAVRIASGNTQWQNIHWKTIVSLYGRSPFFEHFEYTLRPLFETKFEWLHDWNRSGIELISRFLGLDLFLGETNDYIHSYPGEILDWRGKLRPAANDMTIQTTGGHVTYYQVFAHRNGFIPDCSILDLLFCEGLYSKAILQSGNLNPINASV